MQTRILIIAAALALLSGCASGPVGYLVDRDLDAAIKIADTYQDAAGAKCWRDLKLHNSMPVDGIFSAWQHAKTFPLLEGCFRR